MTNGEKDLLLTLMTIVERVERKLDRIDEGLKLMAQIQGSVIDRMVAVEGEVADAIDAARAIGAAERG